MKNPIIEFSDGSRKELLTNTGKPFIRINDDGTPEMVAEPAKLIPLDATLANIAANTVAVTGPAWGVTTDNQTVFLPAGGAAVDTGSGVDWIGANDLVDPATGLIRSSKLPDLIIAGLRQGTRAELDAADPALEANEPAWETDTEVLRVGGDRYEVKTLNTASSITAIPGDDLAAKYTEAKALTPNGSALSATNRAKLVLMPGTYPLAATFTVDTNFVDIVGLGASFRDPKVVFTGFSISVPNTVTDCEISGISVGSQAFVVTGNAVVANDLRVFTNCRGGNLSFNTGMSGVFSSTAVNCVAGGNSFGADTFGAMTGKMIGCTAVGMGAGGFSCSGTLIDCDFPTSTLSGTTSTAQIINCRFSAWGGASSGYFRSCVFGGAAAISPAGARLFFCSLTDPAATFNAPTGTGVVRLCIDGAGNEVNLVAV